MASDIESPLHLARLAVEFTYQLWTEQHQDLFPRPAGKVYWTVRLGRLALKHDGTWAYWSRANWATDEEDMDFIRRQRFMDFEDAVKVATKVFCQEPEHAAEARKSAKTIAEP